MRPFERLLHAPEAELKRLFERLQASGSAPMLDEVARSLGLERDQLLCACGFNPNVLRAPTVVNALGFEGFSALWRARDKVFVEDGYHVLSIDDVLAIYQVLGRADVDATISDLIQRRLNTIEEQIEATINPITVGSYKLEVCSIYEHLLVSREFLEWRMEGNYAVLRRLSNEVNLMLASGLIKADELLASSGVTVDEKARLVHDRLVSADEVSSYLATDTIPEPERYALRQALTAGRGL